MSRNASNPKAKAKATPTSSPEPYTTTDLRRDPDIWFGIQTIIYDFGHLSKPKKGTPHTIQTPSDLRIERTTHNLYISPPYLTETQASKVLSAIVDSTNENSSLQLEGLTVEQAIRAHINNFLEKRSASGDYRPCGPHDLQPAFLEVLGFRSVSCRVRGW